MSKSSKIVDLVMDSDGAYAPKDKKVVTKKPKFNDLRKHEKYNKYNVISEVDEFLNGVDIGLDFLESVVPRVDRFLRLKDY